MRRKKPNMVRVKGLEPPRHCHQNLNLACLPISPHPRFSAPLLGCIAHLARRTSFLKPFADDIDAFFSPENSKSVRKQNISCKSVPFSCTFLAEAGLAQLVEQLICNHQVGGSSPSAGTTVKPLFRSKAFFYFTDIPNKRCCSCRSDGSFRAYRVRNRGIPVRKPRKNYRLNRPCNLFATSGSPKEARKRRTSDISRLSMLSLSFFSTLLPYL